METTAFFLSFARLFIRRERRRRRRRRFPRHGFQSCSIKGLLSIRPTTTERFARVRSNQRVHSFWIFAQRPPGHTQEFIRVTPRVITREGGGGRRGRRFRLVGVFRRRRRRGVARKEGRRPPSRLFFFPRCC